MTFTSVPAAASTTPRISLSNRARSPLFSAPMLMTISTSSAPLAMASLVSKALTAVVLAPKGKPMTVHTFTPLPLSSCAASATWQGLTHTLAV